MVDFTRSGLRALSQACPSFQIQSFKRFNVFISFQEISIFMNVFFTDADRLAILLSGFARAARSVILFLFGSK